jgi:hypothetical protein
MKLQLYSKFLKRRLPQDMPIASERKKSNYRMPSISMAIILVSGMLAWQCTKNTDSGTPQSLKESLTAGTQNLTTAVSEISKTYGYKVITLNDGSTLKSALSTETTFQDSITLAMIKGVYEYQPVTYQHWCYSCFTKLFKKTGDNDHLIVKLPESKIFTPHKFKTVIQSDSTLKNNLVIDASDYHYYFSWGFLWDYKLTAGVTLNDTVLGNLNIQSSRISNSAYSYSSSYSFPNNYSIAVNVASGDTSTSSVALSGVSGILIKETVNRYKTGVGKYHEKQYILDVGNVEFKKSSGSDSIKVYVAGVLQTKAKVEAIDSTQSTGSIFSGRNLKVTYDDGTTATLSSLLGPSMTVLNTMVVNLQNVYFASNIVDYIAFNIFKNKN